jgi:hypothetical protein
MAAAMPQAKLIAGQPGRAAKLEAALAALEQLDLAGLRVRWRGLIGREAPATFRMPLLRAALAYKLQERALGGLKPATRRLLRRVADAAEAGRGGRSPAQAVTALISGASDTAARRRTPQAPVRIKPGTRLLRTWQGSTHEVLVGESGVTYRGQAYRSLSEVARLITGQRWSGPLFFGLKQRASPRQQAAAEMGVVTEP